MARIRHIERVELGTPPQADPRCRTVIVVHEGSPGRVTRESIAGLGATGFPSPEAPRPAVLDGGGAADPEEGAVSSTVDLCDLCGEPCETAELFGGTVNVCPCVPDGQVIMISRAKTYDEIMVDMAEERLERARRRRAAGR